MLDTDKKAPWNQEELPIKKIKAFVSITLSKTVDLEINDYSVITFKDMDGNTIEKMDFYNSNLEKALYEQHVLPNECWKIKKEEIEDLKGWEIDDLEVIPEHI